VVGNVLLFLASLCVYHVAPSIFPVSEANLGNVSEPLQTGFGKPQ
jgi:hypothetical protein